MSDLMRVGGLVSGQDTQTIIDQLVAIEGRPIQTLEAKKIDINADIAAWTDIKSSTDALLDALDTLRSWNVWNQMATTSSDETKLTATASSSAIPATYSIDITQLAQAHSVSSDRASDLFGGATSTTDLVAAGVLTAGDQFTVEGQTITIAASESLQSLQTQINNAATSMPASNRVIATILDNRLVVTRLNSGTTQIAMAETLGTPLQALQIFSAPATYKPANVLVTAQDANFTVNGAPVTRSSNTGLTDVISGVTLNLLAVTATPVTLTVANDTAGPKAAILDFIEKYNAATTKMTDYGKIALSGSSTSGARIETIGELGGDGMIASILRNMRNYATRSKYPFLNDASASPGYNEYTYAGKTGIASSLDTIGIGTADRNNKLSLTDETKLDGMLLENFEVVEKLFRGYFETGTGYVHGVATEFYTYVDAVTTNLTGDIDEHLQALNEQITGINTDIANRQSFVDAYENRLWAQFGAMEDAMSRMSKDLSWLTTQLGIQ
ncbi:MAG: flagellar filament capping protein FliD [Lentisphaerae bacterium]|nr:flagellar filament capping protein FliD [Lentisphaerota bacterium]